MKFDSSLKYYGFLIALISLLLFTLTGAKTSLMGLGIAVIVGAIGFLASGWAGTPWLTLLLTGFACYTYSKRFLVRLQGEGSGEVAILSLLALAALSSLTLVILSLRKAFSKG